jgi:peroxiredoxin
MHRTPLFLAAVLATLLAGGAPPVEAANWLDLNGRVAPEVTFPDGFNGVGPGTRIADYRNRAVVLLAFWLRDCPHCKKEMPVVQRLYDEHAGFGLQVISVVHGFGPAEVAPVMRERGWDFPCATDPDGRIAQAFGGGRRPGFYLIGADGRVKASNALPENVLLEELGRLRLAQLGQVPPAMEAVRQAVWRADYAVALLEAERMAGEAAAGAEVKAVATRLAPLARAHLDGREWRARRAVARGQGALATQIVQGLGAAYERTSLASHAKEVEARVVASVGR